MPAFSRFLPSGMAFAIAVTLIVVMRPLPASAFLDELIDNMKDDASRAGGAVTDMFSGKDSGGGFFSGYPSDRKDACYRDQKAMADLSESFAGELLQNTVVGALVGGGVAALTSGGRGIWQGMAIGAGTAAAGTYISEMQQRGLSAREVTSQISADVSEENRKIDQVIAAFDRVVACRKRQAESIRQNMRRGQITRAEAEAQMADLRKRYREDVAKAQEIAETIAKRTNAYSTAYNQIAADNGADQLVVSEYRPAGQETKPAVAPSNVNDNLLEAIKGSNVRAGPGTDFAKVGKLRQGDRVQVVANQGKWVQINWGSGQVAYVYGKLLGPIGSAQKLAKQSETVKVVPVSHAPITGSEVKPVTLQGQDKRLVGELQEDCVTNVRKRDIYQERVAAAQEAETSIVSLG